MSVCNRLQAGSLVKCKRRLHRLQGIKLKLAKLCVGWGKQTISCAGVPGDGSLSPLKEVSNQHASAGF